MARNMKAESEFGLPSPMPTLPGSNPLPALTDADAIAAGATGQEAGPVGSLQQLGHELREIYAQGTGTLGTQEPKAGTQ